MHISFTHSQLPPSTNVLPGVFRWCTIWTEAMFSLILSVVYSLNYPSSITNSNNKTKWYCRWKTDLLSEWKLLRGGILFVLYIYCSQSSPGSDYMAKPESPSSFTDIKHLSSQRLLKCPVFPRVGALELLCKGLLKDWIAGSKQCFDAQKQSYIGEYSGASKQKQKKNHTTVHLLIFLTWNSSPLHHIYRTAHSLLSQWTWTLTYVYFHIISTGLAKWHPSHSGLAFIAPLVLFQGDFQESHSTDSETYHCWKCWRNIWYLNEIELKLYF